MKEYAVPENYHINFVQAFLTFQHQRIFNLDSNKLEMLYEPNLADWAWMEIRPECSVDNIPHLKKGETDFLGPEVEVEVRTDEMQKDVLLTVAIGD